MAERSVTRTLIGAQLATERGLNLKHNVLDNTTINQAINSKQIVGAIPEPAVKGMEVLPEYNYNTDSDKLFIQCLVIGNGGHKYISGSTGDAASNSLNGTFNNITAAALNISIPYAIPVPHRATDTGLFNMIPFVIREVTDDLTIAERKRFALRRTLEIDNILYAAYYGRILEYARTTASMNVTEVVDGKESTFEFVPTFNDLKPTHPTEDVHYSASYGNVTAPIEVLFDEDDIQDLKEACRILYNNENYAIISELALCSAVVKPISQKYPNSGIGNPTAVAANTFFEMVAAQITTHITTHVDFIGVDRDFTINLDLGATEPLFGAKS